MAITIDMTHYVGHKIQSIHTEIKVQYHSVIILTCEIEMYTLESLPLNVIQNIFINICDIQSRLRLESVNRRMFTWARRFSWIHSEILEITPHFFCQSQVYKLRIKLFSKEDVGFSYTLCAPERLEDAFDCIWSRIPKPPKEIRLWGSASLRRMPIMEAVDRVFQYLIQDPWNLSRVESLLLTDEFASSQQASDLLYLLANSVRSVHLSVRKQLQGYPHAEKAWAAVAACHQLRDCTLQCGDSFDQDTLAFMMEKLINLNSLRIMDFVNFNGMQAATLLNHLPNLVTFSISNCHSFLLGEFLNNLDTNTISHLKKLSYSHWETDLYTDALLQLPEKLPNLEILEITDYFESCPPSVALGNLVVQYLQLKTRNNPAPIIINATCQCCFDIDVAKSVALYVCQELFCDDIQECFDQKSQCSCTSFCHGDFTVNLKLLTSVL